jgi:tetratricopeptide (TPR) repeat protein
MLRAFTILGLSAGFLFLCLLSASRLESAHARHSQDEQQLAESLYLPQAGAVAAASFGYKNALAHLLWFKTISYFGKEYRGSKNYRWLSHMCELVVGLSPRSEHVYRFCGTMLAWEGNQPELSIRILDKAVNQFPENWYFLYLRGFTFIYFLQNEERGNADIIAAAQKPGAHPIVMRLAAKKLSASHSPEAAISFLQGAIRMTEDRAARSALQSRLTEAYYELGFELIERAIQKFRASEGILPRSLEELEGKGLIPQELSREHYKDPFGGRYQLDPLTGTVTSSSGKPRNSVSWNKPHAPAGKAPSSPAPAEN